ncbi:MAG: NADPH-dependent reductase [Symbiobacteriaceae bacterium]|jgi:multimeric flavodoxin WrbA|nr:NADPH-dependent reductase [Symbiobacteriaceae bacterium]
MDWAILDGFEGETGTGANVGALLRSRLDQAGKQYAYLKLSEKVLTACRSCGACSYKSPGKCVVADDHHEVMRAAAASNVLVYLSPVRFGGYSSRLKIATEKFMNLGLPYYMVRRGQLLHRMRYGEKSLLTIGVTEMNLAGQEDAFRLLGRRNAKNLVCRQHRSLVLQPSDTWADAEAAIDGALKEALTW